MDITLLIQTFVVLVVILAILIFLLLRIIKSKKKAAVKPKKKIPPLDLKTLRNRLKNKELSSVELQETMDLIIKEFGVIDDFALYVDIIVRMTRHISTNKEIVLSFEKELSERNPIYARYIERSVINGLSTR